MGILRRLREWREDANGILTGPAIDTDTLDANSVNTDDLTNKGFPDDDPRELLGFIRDDSFTTVSETLTDIGLPESRGDNEFYTLEIIHFEADSGSTETLSLSIQGVSSGDYEFILHDENGAFDSRVTGASDLSLIETTTTSSNDRHSAIYHLAGRDSQAGFGLKSYSPYNINEGKVMFNGQLSGATADADWSLSTNSEARLMAAVWRSPNRGDL
jgi:hypothetical protein